MGRCMCMTKKGNRCSRSSSWTMGVCFGWDPIKGLGVDGPDLKMCRQHGDATFDKPPEHRIRVIAGWYGRIFNQQAKVWTVMCSVFLHPTRHVYSPLWWRFRLPSEFGGPERKDDYDQARASMWNSVEEVL